jgi:hypothetical protein
VAVPVNPRNVGVSDFTGNSPAAFSAARSKMQQVATYYGLHTAKGEPAANLRGGQTFSSMHEASHAAMLSARETAASTNHGGGGGYSGTAGSASLGNSNARASSSSVGHSSGGGGHK